MPEGNRMAGFGPSVFAEVSARASQVGAINLAQGFPDFDGPDFVREAARRAIGEGHGQYARTHGLPALNEAIAARCHARGMRCDPHAEVTVTSGATEALAAAVLGLCEHGDEVVVIEPAYDSYLGSLRMAGARPLPVTLRPTRGAAGGWALDLDALHAAMARKPRALLLNTPHNPTGAVLDRTTLAAVAEACVRHDVLCISDEVYEELVYEGEHISIATMPGMAERTVTVSSLGKTFSLTGWKIGWAVAPPPLTRALRAVHQFLTFSTATPLQHAAVTALQAAPDYYDGLRSAFRARRDLLASGLASLGFEVEPPAGTYFICAGIRDFGMDDRAMVDHLLTHAGVAVIPPSAFHLDPALGHDYVRVAFCKRPETLDAALARLRDWRARRPA
jgi:aspartate/methionine/tyrosine aminotransferase